MIPQLTTDLSNCQGMEADVARVEKWAEIFANPTVLAPTLVKNVLKNYKVIESDISDLSTEIAADDFYKVGIEIADVMVKSVGPVPATQPEDLVITQW